MTKIYREPCLMILWALFACDLLAQPTPIPQRIISMIPAITEMLFEIGAGPQVIAVSSFDRAPEVDGLPRVGALRDPDTELVFSLRPDLVAIYSSQTQQQEQMARAGISVFSYRHGGLADIMRTIRDLGERTGHRVQANAAAAAIESELAAIRTLVADRKRPRTLLVFGREPNAIRNVYASGGIGFLHDILEVAGGHNVFADVLMEATQPSSEVILAKAPEIVIELRAEGATENEIMKDTTAWKAFGTVPAVREGRIHVLTGRELVVPGPRVPEVARRLAMILHPDAF